MDDRKMIQNAKYREDDTVVLCAVTEFVFLCHGLACKTPIF